MKRYETAEEEFKDQFSDMKSTFTYILIFVNLGMGVLSYLAYNWALLFGSLISSFFIYLMSLSIFDNAMRYFISKYK